MSLGSVWLRPRSKKQLKTS